MSQQGMLKRKRIVVFKRTVDGWPFLRIRHVTMAPRLVPVSSKREKTR